MHFLKIVFLLFCCELKAPLAVVLWLEAFTAWENKEWLSMSDLIEEVLFLQPHEVLYYTMGSWHMAWNASNDAAEKGDVKLYDNYVQQGRKILEEGIRYNPQSSLLYEQLGVLLRDKIYDHLAASRAFAQAALLPGAPSYLRRFAAYELATSPGHEAEAYEQLQELYAEGPAERVPALLAKIKLLEGKFKKDNERRP